MGKDKVSRTFAFVILAAVVSFQVTSGYDVIWNIPTELCSIQYNVSFEYVRKYYGIRMNSGDQFRGNEINLLYNPGLFPEIKGYKYEPSLKMPDISKLELINGGLPQNGDMMKHLDALELEIKRSVPDPKNRGLIVIDMEHFGATWNQNFYDMEIYRIMSRRRVLGYDPILITPRVEAQAKLQYERAATIFIIKTLLYIKALRPYSSLGYYQYPQCFNGVGVDFCSNGTMEENNQMILLWKNSDALFPSAYLPKDGTAEEKAKRTRGKVKEAKRVFRRAGKMGLIFPYISYKYYNEKGFIRDTDLEAVISAPKQEGANGVILWGSSSDLDSLEKCKIFDKYVRKSIGPIARKYISK